MRVTIAIKNLVKRIQSNMTARRMLDAEIMDGWMDKKFSPVEIEARQRRRHHNDLYLALVFSDRLILL